MKIRKNVKHLTTDEKRKFAEAMVILKDIAQYPSLIAPLTRSRYDDFVETHLRAMQGGNTWAHGDSAFFPWHRELLYRFELLIQSIPGYEEVTIPYWDWTRDQSSADAGFPFTHDFIGVDGDDSDSDIVKREVGAPTNPYPYPFDPEDWPVRITDGGGAGNFTRAFGEWFDAPNLPDNDQTVVGTGTYFRQAIGSNNYLTLRARSEDLHNLVHRWVGGNMLEMTSPNDPVFFLHHCAIDRMWSLWQDKFPNLTAYQHNNNVPGHGLNQNMIFYAQGQTAPWVGTATPNDVINGHTMHGNGVWYDTDLPEITLETPSVNFGDVPEGMTQYRAVRFRIQTARTTRFRITGAPTGNFGLTPMGTEFIVQATGEDFVEGFVWVQFLSAGGNAVQNSAVDIQAYIVDDEGYYANTEGGEYSKADWTYNITLAGRKIPRVNNAVSLVLDRSGSMAINAGGSNTRISLVRSAAITFKELLKNDDEIGLISFNSQANTVLSLTQAGAANNYNTLVNGNSFNPTGLTAVGAGIQAGRNLLNNASQGYQEALVVLTDGHETASPTIAQVANNINTRTYAIGFGKASDVNTAALQAIAQNNSGELVITGDITTSEQQFLLSKYFIQILAGISKDNIVLDPQGDLVWGATHTIPFNMTEADIAVDVIVLSPLPAILDFYLLTPQGDKITPQIAGIEPNVGFYLGTEVVYYRLSLPALVSNPNSSHSGQWNAVLQLKDRKQIMEIYQDDKQKLEQLLSVESPTVPYSLIVKSFSNLEFEATHTQNSFEPGAIINLMASIKEYNIPLSSYASVVAELTAPNGSMTTIPLHKVADGVYEATYKTSVAGVYTFRVRAEGSTQHGSRFSREKVLTAGVFVGGDKESLPIPNNEVDEKICQILHCLFSEKVMNEEFLKRMEEMGINIKALKECLMGHFCQEKPRESASIKELSNTLSSLQDFAKIRAILMDDNLGIAQQTATQKIQPIELPKCKKMSSSDTPFQSILVKEKKPTKRSTKKKK